MGDLVNRLDIIRKDVNLQGKGLEIGPSFSPICPKAAGFDIEVLDVADQSGLIAKYKDDKNVGSRINNIELVDYVWKGGTYVQLIGSAECYDYIIASHVIEHQVDLLAWLQDLEALLKDDGIITLAVPDSRFEFDFFRQPTHIGEVLDTHEHPGIVHSYGRYVESLLHSEMFMETTSFPLAYRTATARLSRQNEAGFRSALNSWSETEFRDIHSWVFTPASFALLCYELQILGLVHLSISSLTVLDVPCAEFYVQLRKSKDASTRLDGDKLLALQLALKEEQCRREEKGRQVLEVPTQGRVFIYGAGRVGGLCQTMLADKGIKAEAFLVTDLAPGMQREYCNLPVLGIEEVSIEDEDLIVIGVRGCAAMDIRQGLIDRGLKNYTFLV